MVDETEVELKKIQLDLAKVDLEAKRLDLLSRPSFYKSMLSNPVVVAAAIAALVTITSGIISYTVSKHQKQLEAQKAASQADLASQKADADKELLQLRTEADVILEAVKAYNPDQAAINLQFLIDAGLVPLTAPRLADYLRDRRAGTGKVLPPQADRLPINPPRRSR
jgi:hypothetical protein